MNAECHAHLFMDGINYRQAVEDHKNQVNMEKVRSHLADYREAGITYVRDGGDRFGVSARARELAGDYGIEYVTPVFAIHRKGHYGGIVGREAETLQEFASLVEEAGRQKADFVKIMVSGIMDYTVCGRLSEPALEPEWIREMIHIAHEMGFSVMVHANGREAVLPAVLAGADSIEHGNYIDRECLEAMAQQECVWVPTVVTTKNLLGCGRYPEEALEQIYERECETICMAGELSVMLAAGSDAGAYLVPHGKGARQEEAALANILLQTGKTESEIRAYLEAGEKRIREKF